VVGFTHHEQDGSVERTKLGSIWERRERFERLRERKADEGERSDARIGHGRSERDVRAEGPADEDRRPVGFLVDPVDGRSRIVHLLDSGRVAAFRSHHPPEVEGEDGESTPGEVVPDVPQDGMVLASTVLRMRMQDHGRATWPSVGEAYLALERHAVRSAEANGIHGVGRWQTA
jgi:hypothetical protein